MSNEMDSPIKAKSEPFCFFFEQEKLSSHDRKLTPQEIRDIVGGIPPDIPILLCLEDGTKRTLQETEEVKLEPCPRLEHLPRFRRG